MSQYIEYLFELKFNGPVNNNSVILSHLPEEEKRRMGKKKKRHHPIDLASSKARTFLPKSQDPRANRLEVSAEG